MNLDRPLERATSRLLDRQHADGYWVYELGCDASVTAESLYLRHLLGRVDPYRQDLAVRWLLANQAGHGGWGMFEGGEFEINATVKCYLALKLAGLDPQSEPLAKAREAVLAGGGLESCHLFTKIYLAWGGLYPWSRLPHMPIEILRLPEWLFSRYDLSYWARTILVPLLITLAHRPVLQVPVTLEELSVERRAALMVASPIPGWQRHWIALAEKILSWYGHRPLPTIRAQALAEAESWTIERFSGSDGLGAIWPAMVNAVMALVCQGHSQDSPALAEALQQLDRLECADAKGLRVQPCLSPVWDTAWAMMALLDSGMANDHPALDRAGRWLLERQALLPGDWVHGVSHPVAPGGWYFQHRNEFYPDVDDTAAVLMALSRLAIAQEPSAARQIQLGRDWILAMQNSDGGWGAFDRTRRRREWLNSFSWARPFDGALLDPSTADVSARCLEALLLLGYDSHPASQLAARFLRRTQEADGAWFGRWGVNYVYGTWSALSALSSGPPSRFGSMTARGIAYLENSQLPDGGWGETCQTYQDPACRGGGPSTPSQTAWALLGLLAARAYSSSAIGPGLRFLLERQQPEGSWPEAEFTGTGFPRVFYLHYGGYGEIFPTLALARYRRAQETGGPLQALVGATLGSLD